MKLIMKISTLGILALLVLLSGCDMFGSSGDDTPDYVGTWKGQIDLYEDGTKDEWMLADLTETTFLQKAAETEDMSPVFMGMKGVLSVDGDQMTTTIDYLWQDGDLDGDGQSEDADADGLIDAGEWVAWGDLTDTIRQNMEQQSTVTYSVSGDTLTITESDGTNMEFTKQ